MTTLEARGLFREIAQELGLSLEWRLAFDKSKRRFGKCSYGTKTISLSEPLVTLNDAAKVAKTIRHEIAHALVGPFHGHDWVWKAMDIKCGGDGSRCYDSSVETPPAPWVARCVKCGFEYKRHRAPNPKAMRWCSKCGAHAGFKPELALSFAPRPGTVTTPKMISDNPQVLEVLRLRSQGMGYVAIDAKFGVFGKKGWWSWKIVKDFG